MNTAGKKLWVIAVLGILSLLLGFATAWAQAPDPDLNDDGVVNILDISLVGSCFGIDLSTNPQCQVADTDGDGDVDMDDLNFVVAGFGQLFPVVSTPPVVTITDPANLSLFNTDPISVSGTVNREVATVEVNGIAATVNGQTWFAAVPLNEGNNTLTAVAEDAVGNIGTASIQVTRDTTAPQVTIDSPGDGFITNSASITVAGMINDIVVGTANGDQAQVTVNGIPAQVANRSFLVAAVPLSPGPNSIVAIGTDRAGNSASTSITVTFSAGLSLSINEGASITAGGTLTLTPEMLSASSLSSPPEEIVFTLIEDGYSSLLSGYLAFSEAPDKPVSSFTQADLDAGRVIYRDGVAGIVLREIRVDTFLISVSDDAGGESRPRSFLILRNLPEFGLEDGTTVWRVGDGNALFDGGDGDDAFVLRGTDDDEQVTVQPSADGTQIFISVNETETVIVDGIEDLYFVMGSGNNTVGILGDFSNTDLSPSTVRYIGGPGRDCVGNVEPPCTRLTGFGTTDLYDFHIALGPGDDLVNLSGLRGFFVTNGPGDDLVDISGRSGFQHQHVFQGSGGDNVETNGRVHVDETSNSSILLTQRDDTKQLFVDFFLIEQAFRVVDPFFSNEIQTSEDSGAAANKGDIVLDRGFNPECAMPDGEFPPPGQGCDRDIIEDRRMDTIVFVDERIGAFNNDPASPDTQQILITLDLFIEDSEADLPFLDVSYYDTSDITNYRVPNPLVNNAIFGFEITGESVVVGGVIVNMSGLETLRGGPFDDIIFAGDNLSLSDQEIRDFLGPAFSPDSDKLFGEDGNDWMVGDRLNNFFDGGPGDDRMEGQGGSDTFVWSIGNDHIDGGEGLSGFLLTGDFDTVSYETDPYLDDGDPDTLGSRIIVNADGPESYLVSYRNLLVDGSTQGLPETDTLINIEFINGSPRNDIMNGGEFVDRFGGGGGDDRLRGNGGPDALNGGPGHDDIDGGPGNDFITDTEGNNTLSGGPGNDTITGGGGSQTISGGPGNDIISSGAPSMINGGEDDDQITGSNFDDSIDGGPGIDQVDASFGNDTGIFRLREVGTGNDSYDGGAGVDTFRVVILEQGDLTQEEVDGLLALEDYFAGLGIISPRSFDSLGLDLVRWENLEIVDSVGNPVDPNAQGPQVPTDIFLSNNQVEADDLEAFIGVLTVQDPNPSDTHTFDLSDNRFQVLAGNRLFLAPGVSLLPGTDPILLTIGATDQVGLRLEKTFTITVIFEPLLPPTNILLSNMSLREDSTGQAVGFIDVVDPNPGDFHTFTIDDPALPTPRFEVVGGILKLLDNVSIDFETETSVTLDITAKDNTQLSFTKRFTLDVINIDESAPGFPAGPSDLNGTNGFEFTNGLSNGRLGISISSHGDVNGDGFDDILATSYFDANTFPILNDFAYLLPGGSSFADRLTAPDLAAQATTFTMPTGPISGIPNAAHLGDFNGDGYGDVILAASGVNGGNGVLAGGQVYIVLGQAGGLPANIDLTSSATFDGVTAFRIDGGNLGDKIGTTLGSAGDVDGDGFGDALIGFRSGGALIVYGGSGPYPATQVSNNIVDLRSTLINPTFSGIVAGIRDVNGDGYDDIFAGIHPQFSTFSTSGAILFGQPGGLAMLIDPSQTHDVLIGGGAFRSIGDAPGGVGPAGDVNRDGFEDIFLVTNAEGAPTTLNNEIIVLYGGETFADTIDLGDNDGIGPGGASPIAFLGGGVRGVQIVPGGDLGRTVQFDPSFVEGVVGAGDTNGDGSDDLLLRVTNTSTGNVMHSLIFGHPLLPGTIMLDPANFSAQQGKDIGFIVRPGFGFTPEREGSGYHQGLSGMGDINGDGFSDVTVGDPFGEPAAGFAKAGLDYALFGGDLSGLVARPGSTGDDFLLASTSDDLLIGGQGNDTLVGQRGRNVYYGGIGDDLIVVTGLGFPEYARIDGGGGRDTVRLEGDDLIWDLGTTGNTNTNLAGNHLVQSIEVIDLGRGGSTNSHTLIFSVEDLIDLPGKDRSLTVIGDASDTFRFGGPRTLDRSETREGIPFDIYTVDGLFNFELIVAAGVRLE